MTTLRIPEIKQQTITPFIRTTSSKQVKSLYTSDDVSLAFSNLAVLGLQALLKNSYNTPLYIAYIIGAHYQNHFSFGQIPRSKAKAILPLVHLGGIWFPSLRMIGAVGQALGVAISTVPKVVACVKNGFKKPLEALTGVALHLFNLGSQGYMAHQVATKGTA